MRNARTRRGAVRRGQHQPDERGHQRQVGQREQAGRDVPQVAGAAAGHPPGQHADHRHGQRGHQRPGAVRVRQGQHAARRPPPPARNGSRISRSPSARPSSHNPSPITAAMKIRNVHLTVNRDTMASAPRPRPTPMAAGRFRPARDRFGGGPAGGVAAAGSPADGGVPAEGDEPGTGVRLERSLLVRSGPVRSGSVWPGSLSSSVAKLRPQEARLPCAGAGRPPARRRCA